jgi:transcriptional regulator with XRE-family HTH domain
VEWFVNGIHNGLPRRLTRLRNEAGLTRQELADRAGVTFNTINDIEKARRKRPMEKTLQSIAQVLDVPYEYLVYGKVPETGSLTSTKPDELERRAPSRAYMRVAYVGAVIAIVGIAALHMRWERSLPPSAYECVVKAPYAGVSDARFDDVDGCGMVEAVYSSSADHSWNVSKFDRTDDDDWRLLPVLTSDESDGVRANLFVHDVNGDNWKDIITMHQDGAEEELLVLDGRDGNLLKILCRPDSETVCPGDEWESEKRVEAITYDQENTSEIVLISTAARSASVPSSLCATHQHCGTQCIRSQ